MAVHLLVRLKLGILVAKVQVNAAQYAGTVSCWEVKSVMTKI